jgi:hypothetical protein
MFALEKTSETKTQALCGLLPIVFFYGEIVVLFTCTEWAWNYPALAMLLVMPSYCLMTCRHIICSVTKMTFNWRQLNPLWFSLFPINTFLGRPLPEEYIAGIVFTATLALFMRFTFEVIGQITGHLGIYCLTIKPKDNK